VDGGLSQFFTPPAGGAAPSQTSAPAGSDGAGDAAYSRTGASVGVGAGRS